MVKFMVKKVKRTTFRIGVLNKMGQITVRDNINFNVVIFHEVEFCFIQVVQ